MIPAINAVVASYRIPINGGGGGGDITWTELTQGTSTNATTVTASVSPAANSTVFVAIAFSVVGGGSVTLGAESITVSGCGLTWTEIARHAFASRRGLLVFRGTSATPTSEEITITFSSLGGTFEQCKYSVDQATNVNLTTPVGTASEGNGASPFALADVGTIHAGDYVYTVIGTEDNVTITESAGTVLTSIGDSTGARGFKVFYNSTDDTPGCTSGGPTELGGIGFTVEKA